MKKTLLLLLFLFILVKPAFNQKIFREGYIIKETGEHFTGLIEFSTNKRIPAVCNFKRFDIAVVISYSPQDISEFGYINGRRFKSVNFENTGKFFEVLVAGQITLFNQGSKYFIQKNNQGFTEIKNGAQQYNENGTLYDFKGPVEFLTFLTEGKIPFNKDNLKLETELIPIISEYNKQSGLGNLIYQRVISEKELNIEAIKSQAYQVRIGVFGGISNYALDLKPLNSVYIPDPQLETTLFAGINLEKIISRKSDRISFRGELLFLEQNFYSFTKSFQSNGQPLYDDSFFEFSGFKLPVLIQYSFTGRRIVPFLNAGPSYVIFLSKNYTHTREIVTSTNDVITFEDKSLIVGFGELTGVVSAGLKIRFLNSLLLNIQGRYEIGSGFLGSSPEGMEDFKQKSGQTSIMIGISF